MKKKIKHFYLHLPFCTSRCGYCSFYTEQFSQSRVFSYKQTLLKEISLLKERYDFTPATIYFGGGTPSLLSGTYLRQIIAQFKPLLSQCEITLECNPITLTPKYINDLLNSGVDRLSLGIQSMNKNNLDYLGRKHLPESIPKLMTHLRQASFNNISGDLIYGLPKQDIPAIKREISDFLKLDLDHVSIYCLSLDKDSLLKDDINILPEDDLVADMYALINYLLEKEGYKQYEISNFARENKHSRHNTSYWDQDSYLGLGAGAYGTIDNMRYYNNNIIDWEQDIKDNVLFPNQEVLSPKDVINEYIMLQLRLNSGLDLRELKSKYNLDLMKIKSDIIADFIKRDVLIFLNEKLYLTDKSKFISNYIISELMEE